MRLVLLLLMIVIALHLVDEFVKIFTLETALVGICECKPRNAIGLGFVDSAYGRS